MAGFASACDATDIEHVKLLTEGAQAVGSPAIRLSCPGYDGTVNYHKLYYQAVGNYEGALKITAPAGVKVLVEMHGGTIHPSASLAHRIVSNFDAGDIGVIYDPQNMVKDGFETTALAIDLLGSYLAHCHVGAHRPSPGDADDRGTTKWRWEGCPLGQGLYDHPKLLACLKDAGFEGFVSVEDFRDCPPEEKFGEAIGYLRSVE